jgi:ankyrin repeat protein
MLAWILQFGRTPLRGAIARRHTDIVCLLLDAPGIMISDDLPGAHELIQVITLTITMRAYSSVSPTVQGLSGGC